MKNYCLWILAMCLSPSISIADSDLDIHAETQLQQETGRTFQSVCGKIRNQGRDQATDPIRRTCATITDTANQLSGFRSIERSLDLSSEQFSGALQQITTEEYAASGSIANEISSSRIDPIISRLSTLRKGMTGFAISGFHINNNTHALTHPNATPWHGSGDGAGDELLQNALSGFATMNAGKGDRDTTENSDAFDYDNYRLTTGIDFRFSDHLVIGGALSHDQTKAEFDNNTTISGGHIDTQGWGLALYGSYYQDQFYLDSIVSYAASDYDIDRNIYIPSNTENQPIDETAKASTDSDDYALSLASGYSINRGALSYGPYGQLNYLQVDIARYQESGAEASGLNLVVDSQKWNSLTSVLGATVSYTTSHQQAVIAPQARVGWIHQFKHDESEITAIYASDPNRHQLRVLTDKPDRNYFELSLSVTSLWQNGIQLFVNYDTLLGLDHLTDHQITLGGRWEF
jgi:uncharacterized protein with beta-barrel porin domain